MTNLIDITNASDADLDSLLGMDDDTVWDLVARFEAGDDITTADLRNLTDEERAIFTDEYSRIVANIPAAAPAARDNTIGINCHVGFCYADAILRADERDQSRWN